MQFLSARDLCLGRRIQGLEWNNPNPEHVTSRCATVSCRLEASNGDFQKKLGTFCRASHHIFAGSFMRVILFKHYGFPGSIVARWTMPCDLAWSPSGNTSGSSSNKKKSTSRIPTLKPLLHKKCNVSLPPLHCLPCSTANALQEYRYSAVGHSRDTLRLGTAWILFGWAL